MAGFRQLAKYSIKSRGVFLLIKYEGTEKLVINDLPERIKVGNAFHNVHGFDFPSKITRTYLRKDDIIGLQIQSY